MVKLSGAVKQIKTWQLDTDAIEAAAKELGIERDVIIGIDYSLHRLGAQKYVPDDDVHVIKLNPYQTKKQLTKTIWHELAHAMQAERHARENRVAIEIFQRYYHNANGNYYLNQYEIEARKIMIENEDRKLVK